jgi:hypothetical protein
MTIDIASTAHALTCDFQNDSHCQRPSHR